MFALLASGALGLAAPQAVGEPDAPSATPALYVLRDADTTVYLFGTFHVLDPKIHWLDGVVGDAFAKSDELVVETMPPDRTTVLAAPVPATVAIGPATASGDFFTATRQAVKAGRAQGMGLENGADMVLLRAARASSKPVEQLETIASQLTMIASIPAEPAPAGGRQVSLTHTMANLQAAWASGDHGLFAAMVNDMRQQTPRAYDILFSTRNTRWTNWIAARMRSPGTAFVAVGAGHLAGPDSLLIRLAERGLISRRVLAQPKPLAQLAFPGPLD